MTEKERNLALYCLKANSDHHSEVCEECTNYPNCDHTIQDDVTETIIKALEQEPSEDCIARQPLIDNWNCCADMLMGEGDAEVVMGWIFDAPAVTPTRKVEQEALIETIKEEIEQHRRKTQSIDPYDLVGDCLDIIDRHTRD